MGRRAVGLAFMLLAIAPAAQAHDSFLIAPAKVQAGQPFTVQVTSSGFFPEPETAIRPNRIFRLIARSGDQALDTAPSPGTVAMQVAIGSPGPEGAIVGLTLSPWPIEIAADEVDHYMDEIGAAPGLRDAVTRAAALGPIRETYSKHLKTIVCSETCMTVGADRPLGLYLEFVAVPDRRGTFALLRNGRPLANQPVFITSEGHARRMLTTNADGRITLIDTYAGPILMSAVDLSPPIDAVGRFTSEWAALTFDARLLTE